MTTVLHVRDLQIAVRSTPVVRGVSFSLRRGQRLGIVGESGSGKSMTALAIMGLLRPPVRVSGGEVLLGDTDMLTLNRRALGRVRGKRISMIYQDPAASLNPLMTVGNQIVEAVRLHMRLNRDAARARAVELLGRVGVPNPRQRYGAFPHEFSGGMRQRVMIAMALAAEPEVLLCDEPTSALDVTTQVRIMNLLDRLCTEDGVAMVLITHDLGVAAGSCDDVAVMYAGQFVEQTSMHSLFAHSQHPYSSALLAAIVDLDMDLTRRIPAIAGQPPAPGDVLDGCAYRDRCPLAIDECAAAEPAARTVGSGLVRCIRPGEPLVGDAALASTTRETPR